jgi:nucleotide-binding universal stress UspA family protein
MAQPNIVNTSVEKTDATALPFESILCAVDGSRGSGIALKQAIALCDPGTNLRFVAVAHEITYGKHAQVDLSEAKAREALDEATREAHEARVVASADLLHGAFTADLLLTEANGGDLLVVGCRDIPRRAGITLGDTASRLAHRAERPLLVARGEAEDDFPQSVLLATDGSSGSWPAARTAAKLAGARHAQLRVVYVPDGMHPEHHREVQKQVELATDVTGSSPELLAEPGSVPARIDEAARATRSSLIVIGKRGLRGVRALGSVSERVLHQAPNSVLVVPVGT